MQSCRFYAEQDLWQDESCKHREIYLHAMIKLIQQQKAKSVGCILFTGLEQRTGLLDSLIIP